MNKRHAKPTTAVLVNRLYRRQIKLETLITQLSIKWRDSQQRGPTPSEEFMIFLRSIMGEQREMCGELGTLLSGQKMLAEHIESVRLAQVETMKPLADHCQRLLREKEALMKAAQQLHAPAAYMRQPLHGVEILMEVEPVRTMIREKLVDMQASYIDGCGFKLLHIPGIRCAVCGELSLSA